MKTVNVLACFAFALSFLPGCEESRAKTIDRMCARFVECFPRGSYSGCVVGATVNDRGTQAELEQARALASAECDTIEVMERAHGIDISVLK